MRRMLLALLLSIPAAALADDSSEAAATETSVDEVVARIAPFLEERTLFVAHADLARFEVDAVFEFLARSTIDARERATGPAIESPGAKAARERFAGLRSAMLAAGARHVYLLAGWDDVPDGNPVVVVPVGRGGAAGAILKLLEPPRGRVIESFRGAVVIGGEPAVARLRASEPAERPDVVEALRATGGAAARLVVVSPAEERRVMQAMLPEKLPEPLGTRYRALFTDAAWYALSIDPPPNPSARLVTSMPDADRAEQMRALQRDLLAAVARWPAAREDFPNIERMTNQPVVSVEEDRVLLSLTDAERVEAFVEALRPNLARILGDVTRDQRRDAMKTIGIAFHNYHDTRQAFPPVASRSPDGKPLLSWRVHLLPYIDQQALYEKFRLDEPWDSPHNKPLLADMPDVYGVGLQPGIATALLPMAEGSIIRPEGVSRFSDVRDGLSNTILAVDVGPDLAVPWTKPADWEVDWEIPLEGVVPGEASGFLALFADGSVHVLERDIPVETLRAYVTREGGESVD